MPQNLQDIRRRIKSVQNTEKITAAMKMVAAAKLRRAQERAMAARPYADKLREVLLRLAANASDFQHPLLQVRPVRYAGVLLLTADRGLAGPYNANLIRNAAQLMGDRRDARAIAVGRKGRDYFRKRRAEILAEFVGLGDEARWEQAAQIGQEVIRLYLEGQVDEVRLVYAQFINAMQNRPMVLRLLPLQQQEVRETASGSRTPYIFEPDAAAVLTRLLPHYVEMLVYRALLEAKASEFGSRMVAMDNASKNAGEMIQRLTLIRNRVRQAAITKEIAEIVGGANALEG